MRKFFNNSDRGGVLLVDAKNAFNLLNRRVALHNIQYSCPLVSTLAHNLYRHTNRLFIFGEELSSEEGTTQGGPFAMVFYGLSITLLIYSAPVNSGKQIWYADDAGGAGKRRQLRHWWDFLCQMGPSFGYYPNAEKTISVAKPEQLNEVKFVSEETGVVITARGTKCLGTPLGSKKYENQLLTNRADIIGKQLEKLSGIASMHPQAAYAGFSFGFRNKWNFLARTVDLFSDHVHCLEEAIENQFIPALLGHPCNPSLQDIVRLSCRLGGLDIQKPVISSPVS